MKYIIVDLERNMIVRWFDNEDEAKESLYRIRKHKYIDEHPTSPKYEYDTIKIDNGYNLFKIKLTA